MSAVVPEGQANRA